jgi:exopolysaccharide production protein ExoQ
MTGQYTLIGLFGSKNMIGIFAEIGILFSLLNLYVRQGLVAKVIFALIPLGICAISLYLSRSASAVITLALTLAVIIALAFISKLPRAMRMITIIAFTLLALFITAVGTSYEGQNLVLSSLGKDSTLTGRTYLWAEGYKSGMEAPFLGHGYQAFWVAGRPKAELLWQKFGIPTRIGFHFHDLFVETFVELGSLGVILITGVLLTTCWKGVRLIIRHGMSVEYVYALGVSFMFLSRAIVEVDLIGTFMIGPVLFFSVIPRLASLRLDKKGYAIPVSKQYLERKVR